MTSAYQSDAVSYVQRVAELFGAYKRRGIEFLDVRPGLSVLDVGCGAGDDALALARMVGPGGRVAGIDASAEMIETARTRASAAGVKVAFGAGDVYRLPFGDGEFDRVRADRLFQHLAEPERALAQMIRVTAPGGLVSVIDVDWATLVVRSDDEPVTRAILDFLVAAQVNARAGSRLYELFKQSGLVDVACYADAVAVTEFGVARWIWGLDVFARKAAEAGRISRDQAETWMRGLEQRDAAGRFFASMTGFALRGRMSQP